MYIHSASACGGSTRLRATNRRKIFRMVLLLSLFGFGTAFGAMLQANAMNEGGSEPAAAAEEAKGEDSVKPAAPGAEAKPKDETTLICVGPGDTLWSIAKQFGPADVPVKTYVQKIMHANSLSSASLKAGDVLILP